MLVAQGQQSEGSFLCLVLVFVVLAAYVVLLAHRSRRPDLTELLPPVAPGWGREQARDRQRLLAEFRFWRWVMVIGFLSFLPMVALGFPLGLPFGVLGLPSAIAFAYAMSCVYDFRCPQCGQFYVRSGRWLYWWLGYRYEFTSQCIHCGFPKTPQQTPET
jgi:hypothetical protein